MYSGKKIAFTGVRTLYPDDFRKVRNLLKQYESASLWVIGDAIGVDACVKYVATTYDSISQTHKHRLKVFHVKPSDPRIGLQDYDFAERSLRMIRFLKPGDLVVGFPNKPCPERCYPCKRPNGQSSGTWLTLAFAKYRDLDLHIHPLTPDLELPEWLFYKQLSLF